jgi:hypothetical protein
MIPTTDEMDHTTPEERNALVGACGTCGEWTKFDNRKPQPKCQCGGDLLQSSIHTQRTFDIERGKKETAKIRKKAKK